MQKRPSQFYVDSHDDSLMDRGFDDYRYDRNDKQPYDQKGDGNKIRRGPGRRIAKEKRIRNMDPALMQKYASLPENLQEKVNATIQICYQQHMANMYKAPGKAEQSHYNTDVEIDSDGEILEIQADSDD